MKTKLFVSNLFLLGVLLSSVIFWPFILDYTLTPRLISISAILLLCLFLLFRSKEFVPIKIDLILFSYSAFIIFSCLSVFWSNTKSESLFENSKLLISICVFLLCFQGIFCNGYRRSL